MFEKTNFKGLYILFLLLAMTLVIEPCAVQAQTYVFLGKFGNLGSGDGEFRYPRGVAVDSSGNVYVADTSNHRIQVFDSSGAFLKKWGSLGSGNGQFNFPREVAVDDSANVYVADSDNNRIQVFDASGNYIDQWGVYGTNDGEFYYPYGVAVDNSGYVYVADTFNHRIQKFGPLLLFCEGDFNGDGDVDGADLAIFAADFGRTDCCEHDAPPCEGDFDNDCDVDGSDLALFTSDYGRTDCPLPVYSLSKTISNFTGNRKQPNNKNMR